ncbi:MAG: FliM/FliN family flagellar motor switch protein [Spirochaetota bacterium]
MKSNAIESMHIPLEVVLGKATVTLAELASIGEGSIIELDRLAGEPIFVVAAGEVVGMGEVVVIDENFGIRITQMRK